MKYLSVCSGIEAATVAWHPLGWRPHAFSEIEKFPSKVLEHHYPDVPNLGDMTKYQEWPDAAIDLLVGGTPCQSFSVAGLRKGLGDPRGNLMLTYGAIAGRYRPRWLVWENVPGVLSSNGGRDFEAFLEMLEELGYVVDCDILDAQYFGLAQRRRRVFVCGQRADVLVNQMTDSSALTIAQCWQEILRGMLVSQCSQYEGAQPDSDLANHSRNGVRRRMKLFGLLADNASCETLRRNLVAALQRYPSEQSNSACLHGESAADSTPAGRLTDSKTETQYSLTVESLKIALEESFAVMKSFITSTETSSITQVQIFSCSRAALIIGKLIQRLNPSCPPFWNAALSSLISLRGFINYARSTDDGLFADPQWVCAWRDFIEQAKPTSDAIGNIGIGDFGEVFPVSESLRGHPAPRRKAGEGVAGTLAASTGGSDENDAKDGRLIRWPAEVASTLNAHYGDKQGLEDQHALGGGNSSSLPSVSLCLNAGAMGRLDAESETLIPTIGGVFDVVHTLKGEGFDAGEHGAGRGTPLVPISYAIQAGALRTNPESGPSGMGVQADHAYTLEARKEVQCVAFSCKDHGADAGEVSPTLRSMGHDGSHANGGGHQAVMDRSGVRRLMPVECERLQGFPDGYTDIRERGKPTPDGPRYKALGNSMAVPCMRWIGRRIELVESISSVRRAA